MKSSPQLLLIIDDSDSDRRIYRRYLSRLRPDWAVEEATSGNAGIQACEKLKPACVLLDFRLPDTDGIEILKKIRAFTDCPVVFISGNPEPLTMTNAFRSGAITYLSKDLLDQEKLGEALNAALGD